MALTLFEPCFAILMPISVTAATLCRFGHGLFRPAACGMPGDAKRKGVSRAKASSTLRNAVDLRQCRALGARGGMLVSSPAVAATNFSDIGNTIRDTAPGRNLVLADRLSLPARPATTLGAPCAGGP